MRDSIKDEEYFADFISRKRAFLPRYVAEFKNESVDYKKRLGFAYDFFRNSSHIAVAVYSSGAPISDVKRAAIDAIDALKDFVALADENPAYFLNGDGGGYAGGFDHWYRLLGWCVLFDLPRDKTDIVLDYLALQMRHPDYATDALVNKFVKYLGYPGQDETDHLLWPHAYSALYDCFKQKDNYPEVQLEAFMTNWYSAMRDTYWHETHNSTHNVYFGYWCFEAAAVAKMLNINDSALKDHPNYPYDARHETP